VTSGRDVVHAYVSLEQDEDGYPPFDTEELEVELRHDGACTVVAVPAVTNGIAVGDIVSVVRVEDDDRWWVTSVMLASGHGTVRVVPFGDTTFDQVVTELAAIGCVAHGTDHGLVAVDVPPDVDPDVLMGVLEAGRHAGRWTFDVGVVVGASG
jgi:hypothetical protein